MTMFRFMLAVFLTVLLCGCGGGSSDTVEEPQPNSVALQAEEVEVWPGQQSLLTANISDVDGAKNDQATTFSILRNDSGATLVSKDTTTNSAGIARAMYQAGSTAGEDIVGVMVEPYGEATVRIKVVNLAPHKQTIKIEAEPTSVPMGGVSFLTATVSDKDGPVPGVRGGFDFLTNQSGAKLFTIDHSTDPNGRIIANYRAGNIPGTDILEARFGTSIAATITITVTSAGDITVEPTSLKATQFVAFSQDMTASGGRPPYSFQLASGSKYPPGITMNQNGVVRGDPALMEPAAEYSFTIEVTDSTGRKKLQTIKLEVVASGADFDITTASIGPVTNGAGVAIPLAANDEGRKPYAWSASGLPNGLSISSNGDIGGIPNAPAGDYSVTVSVSDANGVSRTKNYVLTVLDAPVKLNVLPTTCPQGNVGNPFPICQLSASGGVPPYAWTCESLDILDLECDASGMISGTASRGTGGPVNFTVQVKDSNQNTAQGSVIIDVK